MQLKTKKDYLLWLLSFLASFGASVAPQSPATGAGGMSPWNQSLEPVFNVFEYFTHNERPFGEAVHHAVSDLITWYLQLLGRVTGNSDESAQLSHFLSTAALESILNRRQYSDGVALTGNDANFMGLSTKDLEDFDLEKLETHFQKLIDSFLPSPFATETPTTTTTTTTTARSTSKVGRKFYSVRRNQHGSHHNIQVSPSPDALIQTFNHHPGGAKQ